MRMGPVGGRYPGFGAQWRWYVIEDRILAVFEELGLPGCEEAATGDAGEWLASACAQA